MSKNVTFNEFDPVSSKAWKQKIQVDLKGADYNDTLLWHSNDGITTKPFYHAEESSAMEVSTPEQWHIGESIYIHDPKGAALAANKAISQGAETIVFKVPQVFDITALLDHLQPQEVRYTFAFDFLDQSFYKELIRQAAKQNTAIQCQVDIIGHLAKEGNWFHNLSEDHKQLEDILVLGSPVTLAIDGTLYQNAGATPVQELAYILAHVNEYFNFLEQRDHDKLDIFVTVQVSIGSHYFFEIAKVRALRLLLDTLFSEYAFAKAYQIIATPSRRNKTLYDYNNNMLRTTTECMSAVLGGADVVLNEAYDHIYHKRNDFGQRISRNQLIILKKESYFDAVSNPAEGAYYIESLTSQIAQKSLDVFKNIEKSGGFLNQLKAGTVQRKIKESATKEQEQFDNGTRILVGTNKYPNPEERMSDTIELYPFVKVKPRKTIIEPIIPRRLAEQLEKARLDAEKSN